jgi:hypothetical protein
MRIDDPQILSLLDQAMTDVCVIRLPHKWCIGGPVHRIGYLMLNTKGGELGIIINSSTFGLSAPPGTRDYATPFHSMSLALLVDALLKSEGGTQLLDSEVDLLSGQKYVDREVSIVKRKLAAGVPGLRFGKVTNRVDGEDPERNTIGHEWALWELLDPETEVLPVSARLVMRDRDGQDLNARVDDREIMKLLVYSMWDMITSAPRATDKPNDSRSIGQLDLTLPDGVVQIDIHPEGFRLITVPKELLGPSRVFVFQSPSLAYLIDAICESAGVARNSDKQRKALSGEAYLESQRAATLDRIAKTNALQGESTSPLNSCE